LRSARFQKLTRPWLEGVKANNKAVASVLVEKWKGQNQKFPFEIQTFDHNMYFWVTFPRTLTKEKFDSSQNVLAKSLYLANVPFRHAPSYPWDVLSVTHFLRNRRYLSRSPDEINVSRISLPDFEPSLVESTVAALDRWLTYLERNH
jgi:hypothetical protein